MAKTRPSYALDDDVDLSGTIMYVVTNAIMVAAMIVDRIFCV